MTNASPKLSVSHLQAGYGDVQVLWDVSLAVGAGELICIIGSNGAGKTTLMRCISGLLTASAGDIRIDGQAMTQAAPADFVRAGVAHVPEGRRLFSAMSVRDNLLMGAYLRRDKAAIAADLERVYAMFPILAERRWQDAGTLVRRRAADVRHRPRTDGFAEPAAHRRVVARALASHGRAVVRKPARGQQIGGVAVLLVEQDVMNALELADRAYVIDRGRVTMSGTATSLATDPAIREAYMGLASMIPKRNPFSDTCANQSAHDPEKWVRFSERSCVYESQELPLHQARFAGARLPHPAGAAATPCRSRAVKA